MRFKMKVSAYVPCYNAGATIQEAVRSIFDQTILPTELLVIDDGSTKKLPPLPGVKLSRSATNLGRGATRGRAMAEAQQELVLGCDREVKRRPGRGADGRRLPRTARAAGPGPYPGSPI